MKIEKPAWCRHATAADPEKSLSIYSIDLHPDGTRFATGGNDQKVRVWARPSHRVMRTPSISSEAGSAPKQQLAALSHHTGAVNCVRWSPDGCTLASAADDAFVVLHCLSDAPATTIFGSGDAPNVENWAQVAVLRFHTYDVKDLAWNPDATMLASCSVDNKVCVWNTSSVAGCNQKNRGPGAGGIAPTPLRVFDDHAGFVEGVAWDPMGKYLASASDDKTVIVRRVGGDWAVEAKLAKEYADTSESAYFRRMDWSPDGQHLCTTRACDKSRHIATLVRRGRWDDAKHELIGHKEPVVAARFSPRPYSMSPKKGGEPKTVNCCALGGRDSVITLWVSAQSKPIVILKDCFKASVLDLGWAADGTALACCSLDGTVCILNFEEHELGRALSIEELAEVRRKQYGTFAVGMGDSTGADLAESAAQLVGSQEDEQLHALPQVQTQTQRQAQTQRAGEGAVTSPQNGSATSTRIGRTTDGRKRIRPVLLTQSQSNSPPQQRRQQHLLAQGSAAAVATAGTSSAAVEDSAGANDPSEGGQSKRARTAREQPAILSAVPQQMRAQASATTPPPLPAEQDFLVCSWAPRDLPVAPGLPHDTVCLQCEVQGGGSGSGAAGVSSSVVCKRGDQILWTDQLVGENAKCTAGGYSFCAVGCESGALFVYRSICGRRAFPCVALGAPVCCMVFANQSSNESDPGASGRFSDIGRERNGDFGSLTGSPGIAEASTLLLVLRTDHGLDVWDLPRQRSVLSTSVEPILRDPNAALVAANITPSGVPVITVAVGRVVHSFLYHSDMRCWMRVADQDFGSSDFSSIGVGSSELGLLAQVQAAAATSNVQREFAPNLLAPSVAERRSIVTMRHVEHQLSCALLLSSPREYMYWLRAYTKLLVKEDRADRLRALCDNLLGPPRAMSASHADGEVTAGQSSPFVMPALSRRSLLERDVLPILRKDRRFQRLVNEVDARLASA